MDIKVQEVNGKLICQKHNHNDQIIKIYMDESLPISERLLCVKCLQSNKIIVKILGIDEVKELIKEKQSQQEQKNKQQRSKDLQIINEFQQKLKIVQTQLLKDFEEIQRILQQWINDYDQKKDDAQLANLIKGIKLLNQTNQLTNNQQIRNKSYFLKLSLKFKKMIALIIDFKQPYDYLKQLLNRDNLIEQKQQIQERVQPVQIKEQQIIQNQQVNKQNISQIKLINSIKQKEECCAISFNNNAQIMVAGCNKDIKVWKFEKGFIIEKIKLNGHTEYVNCLVFSKKLNWFASGSKDKTIRCWKEQTNGKWISTQPGQQHTHWINCLLLNSNEDELVSCGDDKSIKVWNVNCKSNQLDYNYTLEQKHTSNIDCISINEQETYLVSCGYDKKIILWHNDNQSKWRFLNEIVNDDHGYRLCFISDDQIVWQQKGNAITHFLEIKNARLIKRHELNIQFNQESGDHALFPTIFNKRKQLIVQSHNRYVYLLKKQENDKLELASDPIDCNDCHNYGSLTDDGECLVVWNSGSNEFRVYQIHYK